MMKTSVIVPTYNSGAKTLRKCLESVIVGNCLNEWEPIELIVVDDRSSDDSMQKCMWHILHHYVQRSGHDNRPAIWYHRSNSTKVSLASEVKLMNGPGIIKVLTLNDNYGVGAARNVGLAEATGDYIVFLDADDQLRPGAIRRMRELMEEEGTDLCVGNTRYKVGPFVTQNALECWHQPAPGLIDVSKNYFLVEATTGVRSKMFKKKLLGGLRFPTGIQFEDIPVVATLLAKAGKISHLDEPVYDYRIHRKSATIQNFSHEYVLDDVIVALDELHANLERFELLEKYRQEFLSMYVLHSLFRAENVVTWVRRSRGYKAAMVAHFLATVERGYGKYSGGRYWGQDPVLIDDARRYKDPFFNMMLKKVYKLYLER